MKAWVDYMTSVNETAEGKKMDGAGPYITETGWPLMETAAQKA